MKRIRLKANATWKQRQAAWLARQREYQRRIKALHQKVSDRDDRIETLKWRNDQLQAEHEQRHREQVKNWQLYDKAYAETSAQEKALFEASPAYLKYQQWRQGR